MTTDSDHSLSRIPRAVPPAAALRWFAEGMRLWKRAPAVFAGLALVLLLVSLAAEPIPFAGFVAANVVAPLLATGLLFASLAADRGERPQLRHLIAVFAAPAGVQATIIAAAIVVFLAEAYAAWEVADVNVFMPLPAASPLDMSAILAVYAAGIVASLPVTFVPFAALFDGERMSRAFALSAQAFMLNIPALAVFAAISFALLMVGLVTMGIGLVLVLPLIAASSYAAWKDIFGVSTGASPLAH
jgi:uncharacterized membrane protein